MKKVKLSDIKISEKFLETVPNEQKMEECRFNWRYYGKQDRYIVINHNNVLIDGYVQYLVLKEHKEEYAEVKVSNRRKKELIQIVKMLKFTCGVFLNLGQVG